jgi:hypothetical protein
MHRERVVITGMGTINALADANEIMKVAVARNVEL